ncbi:peptidoglycan editing factor PgeF [Natroniella acetigena]|uniref:peptidoglycan editing factor PgeF n=1 Tax=Natroniella acetigena TaxID=52004 RepID=UPI00200B8E65|nr:peptidoglycan editing factor PgeF [Natroniella acetigena]MCK8827596.1 peptidoglycan editing factor PgeF [Natroniella acetigena]
MQEQDGIKYYIIEEFRQTGLVKHAFTTRIGGVSSGDYVSLNLGLHVGDNEEDVLENRKRICKLLGSNNEELVATKQMHNDRIKIVTQDDKGRGALTYHSALDNFDALLTDQPGILLTSYYADCTPILILDPKQKVIGLVHAGWKGTVKKITQQAVLKMIDSYGSKAEEILVGVGPTIGSCCYEVDQQVITPLANNFADWKQLVEKTGTTNWKLDLVLANKVQLEEIGLQEKNIINSELCTCCKSALFFSHRKEGGKTGRMASLIKLKVD